MRAAAGARLGDLGATRLGASNGSTVAATRLLVRLAALQQLGGTLLLDGRTAEGMHYLHEAVGEWQRSLSAVLEDTLADDAANHGDTADAIARVAAHALTPKARADSKGLGAAWISKHVLRTLSWPPLPPHAPVMVTAHGRTYRQLGEFLDVRVISGGARAIVLRP